MRRLSILILMLLCAAVSLRAQSLDAFKQRLAEPVAGTAFFGRAQVTVAEPVSYKQNRAHQTTQINAYAGLGW